MVLSPIFLALGCGRDERAQRAGPVRGGGDRPDRLQPRDHRRGARCSPRRSVPSGWPSASSLGSLGHLLVQLPPLQALGFRYTAADRLLATRRRARRSPSWPRGRSASAPARSRSSSSTALATTLGLGAVTAFTIAFTLLQIPIGVIGVPLGRRPVPVARRAAPRSATATSSSASLDAGDAAARGGDDPGRRRSPRSCASRPSRCSSATAPARCDPGDRGHVPRVPARAAGPRTDRGAGSRLLRATGHASRRSLAAVGAVVVNTTLAVDPRRPARAARAGRRDRRRGLGRGDRPGRPPAPARGAARAGHGGASSPLRTLVAAALAALAASSIRLLLGPALAPGSGIDRARPGSAGLATIIVVVSAAFAAAFVGARRSPCGSGNRALSSRSWSTRSAARARDVTRRRADPRRLGRARRHRATRAPISSSTGLGRRQGRQRLGGAPASWPTGHGVGAQILVRRPRPLPWGFAYAPRGPVGGGWSAGRGRRLHERRSRRSCRHAAGRVSHLRIDPEIELDGPHDPDGALRRALRAAGWRPAPPIQPALDAGHRPARRTRTALWGDLRKKWRQYVNKARSAGVRRRRCRGRPPRRVLPDLPRDRRSRRVPHPRPRPHTATSGRRSRPPAGRACCSPRRPTASRSRRCSSSAAARGSWSRTAA